MEHQLQPKTGEAEELNSSPPVCKKIAQALLVANAHHNVLDKWHDPLEFARLPELRETLAQAQTWEEVSVVEEKLLKIIFSNMKGIFSFMRRVKVLKQIAQTEWSESKEGEEKKGEERRSEEKKGEEGSDNFSFPALRLYFRKSIRPNLTPVNYETLTRDAFFAVVLLRDEFSPGERALLLAKIPSTKKLLQFFQAFGPFRNNKNKNENGDGNRNNDPDFIVFFKFLGNLLIKITEPGAEEFRHLLMGCCYDDPEVYRAHCGIYMWEHLNQERKKCIMTTQNVLSAMGYPINVLNQFVPFIPSSRTRSNRKYQQE